MLPIESFISEILTALSAHQAIVIAAETGAGKSTRVPLALLEAGLAEHGLIGVTQPRRVAAMSVAEWVASLHGSKLGSTIGYHIKAVNETSRDTKVKFMTEGILLRELHSDPMLRKYSVVVIDEAHERGINQDLLLALVKTVMPRRPDLKVVVMSATINEQRFAEHLGEAPVIKVPGRVFPVEVRYEDRTPDRLSDMVAAVADKIESLVLHDEGDILAFLPDEASIRAVCDRVDSLRGVRILPLYGSQDPAEQREVFKRGARRVIVATNIAETSVTIDGVYHVVDSGLIKAVRYVSAAMSSLTVMEHSKAGCDQRKGRAGRTAPGVCHRMFAERDFHEREAFTQPEILRTSLDQILLHLRVLKYSFEEVIALPFMDPPGAGRWREAEDRLRLLGALDHEGNVTPDGYRLEKLPVAPMLGRMLLSAEKYGCVSSVATIVAAMSARQLFIRPKSEAEQREANAAQAKFKATQSDPLALRAACVAWVKENRSVGWARKNFLSTRALDEIARNREHILEALQRSGMSISQGDDEVSIQKAIASGLIINLCTQIGPHGYAWQGKEVFVHPGSAMREIRPRYLVCTEVVLTSRSFARGCTSVAEEWLEELLPESVLDVTCQLTTSGFRDASPVIRKELRWQGTVIRRYDVEIPTESDLASVAAGMAVDILDGLTWSGVHPRTSVLRDQWNTLLRLKGLQYSAWNRTDAVEELRVQLAARIFEQIRHARSLTELLAIPLSIPVVDWLTPGEREVYEARERAALEARERAEREQAVWRAEAEARMAPLREEITALAEEASLYPDVSMIVWALEDARSALSSRPPREEMARAALSRARTGMAALRARHAGAIALTRMGQTQALEALPSCPLCGAAWSFKGGRATCGGAHDVKRVVRTREDTSNVLARLVTNRGDVVATVKLLGEEVQFAYTQLPASPWTGRIFSSVETQAELVVLPEELTPHRDNILKDIADLRTMRKEAEQLVQTLRDLERRAKNGTVRRLTFRLVSGMATAEEGGQVYSAAYSDVYPDHGETWFCVVPRSQNSQRRTIEVTPILKVEEGTVKGHEEVVEFERLVRESYPGLPEALLTVN